MNCALHQSLSDKTGHLPRDRSYGGLWKGAVGVWALWDLIRPTSPFQSGADRLACPKMSLVCCHGFYPNIADMITVAIRNDNVFVSPDMYTFAAGDKLYIEAANRAIGDNSCSARC
ncbi:hypothetical protein FOHLNKBM_5371 [Methylobacterium longum]|nr:hypothetical protein FOHLNKBM_5371 [Methylobacterium longum]